MDNVLASRTLDQKPIAPALFAHFVLRSANMQPMVDWYTTVLNMHVVKRNDFICFLNKFAAGDLYANCDGSTTPSVLNILDFTCFLNRFVAGCP